MFAGFAEIEFTPKSGIIPGQILPDFAEGTRTPLMAHAAAITSGAETTVLVSVDILYVSLAFAERMRRAISERYAIPRENVLIACTHTHTGCATDNPCWLSPTDPVLIETVGEAILKAVEVAYESRTEATLSVGITYEDRFSYNRIWYLNDGTLRSNPGYIGDTLYRPFGKVDQSVNVLRIDDTDGKVRAFVVNYANHPDNHRGYEREKFSADYPGYLRLALQKEYGEDIAVLFLNGTCGDVNDLDFKNGYSKTYRSVDEPPKIIGEGIAERITALSSRITASESNFAIRAKSKVFAVPRRRATEELRAWARDVMAKKAAGENISDHRAELARQYLEEDPNLSDTVDFEIGVIQIGPWALVCLPGEICTEAGLRIKALSPYVYTVISELANGTHGYVTSDALQKGGTYESFYSNIAYTGIGTVDILVNGALELLNELFDEELRSIRSAD